MATKQYKSKSIVSINVMLPSGKSKHIAFSPLSRGESVFYTDDPAIQKALERHRGFGKMFYLVGPDGRPVIEKPAPAQKPKKAAPAPKAEAQAPKKETPAPAAAPAPEPEPEAAKAPEVPEAPVVEPEAAPETPETAEAPDEEAAAESAEAPETAEAPAETESTEAEAAPEEEAAKEAPAAEEVPKSDTIAYTNLPDAKDALLARFPDEEAAIKKIRTKDALKTFAEAHGITFDGIA